MIMNAGPLHASVSGSATATATATATMSVSAGNQVMVKVDGLDGIKFSFDLHNVPSWLDKLQSDLVNEFGGVIVTAINNAIARMPARPVCTVPSVPFTIKKTAFVLGMKDIAFRTLAEVDGTRYLVVTGTPVVTSSVVGVHTLITRELVEASA
jgi:hypothetical protein